MFNSSNSHCEEIIAHLRNQCYRRHHSIRQLIVSCRAVDSAGTGALNRVYLESAFSRAGCFLSQPNVQRLCDNYKGRYMEMIDDIVGDSYSPRRQQCVSILFQKLAAARMNTRAGLLEAAHIENHPFAFSGETHPDKLRADITMAFDGLGGDDEHAPFDEYNLHEYFRGISGAFGYMNDSQFVDVLQKVWAVTPELTHPLTPINEAFAILVEKLRVAQVKNQDCGGVFFENHRKVDFLHAGFAVKRTYVDFLDNIRANLGKLHFDALFAFLCDTFPVSPAQAASVNEPSYDYRAAAKALPNMLEAIEITNGSSASAAQTFERKYIAFGREQTENQDKNATLFRSMQGGLPSRFTFTAKMGI